MWVAVRPGQLSLLGIELLFHVVHYAESSYYLKVVAKNKPFRYLYNSDYSIMNHQN